MPIITKFTKPELIELLKPYKIEVDKFWHVSKGEVNTNIIVKSEKKKYFIKVAEYRRESDARFQVELSHFLQKHNFPVPTIAKTIRGKHYQMFKGKPVLVFEFIEGKHLNLNNKREKQLLLKKIYELQGLLSKYKPKEKPWIKYANDIRHESEWLKTANKKYLFQYWEEMEKELASINYKKLRTQIIHGDINKENVVINPKGEMYFIDFDEARLDYLLYDIAVFLTQAIVFGKYVSIKRCREFLQFFKKVYNLTEEDFNTLRIFTNRRLFTTILFFEYNSIAGLGNKKRALEMRNLFKLRYSDFKQKEKKLFSYK